MDPNQGVFEAEERSRKKTFFDELYAVHEHESSQEDRSELLFPLKPAITTSSGNTKVVEEMANLTATALKSGARRKSTRTTPNAPKSSAAKSEPPKSSGKRKMKPTPESPEKAKKPKTSKSGSSKETGKSDAPKLFTGMKFYYAPKKLAHTMMRKILVKKAIENGAEHVTSWSPDVTHILLDKRYEYNDILKELKLDGLPENVAVVLEQYQPDCLHYGRIIPPNQKHYEVRGCPNGSQSEPSSSTPEAQSGQANPSKSLRESPSRSSLKSTQELDSPLAPSKADVASPLSSTSQSQKKRPVPLQASDLDAVIEEARNLPALDVEPDGNDDDSSHEAPEKRLKSQFGVHKIAGNFQCLSKNDGKQKEINPNKRTIEVLTEMQQYYERTNDTWRSLTYRKAIGILKRQDTKISFASEAVKLPGIGPRIASKIEEIVHTDNLRRLEYAKLEPIDQTIKLFVGIYGVGFEKAQAWAMAGHRTLQDIVEKEKLLEGQRIGVEHYDDFNSRIPREEVEKHGKLVIECAKTIDRELSIEIMGSYRRGASTCGDIDLMITKKNAGSKELRAVLDELTKQLFGRGFLKCGLAVPRGKDDGSKWHGASQLTEGAPWRRIDFLLVPWEERGAALIYFTGNDIFNRSLRLLASKKGYRLNQRGLYKDVMRAAARKRVNDGALVEGASEERIFEILGVPYRSPEDRNC